MSTQYCRNCGKYVTPGSYACMHCGLPPLKGVNFCSSCGATCHPEAVICVKCGIQFNNSQAQAPNYGSNQSQPQSQNYYQQNTPPPQTDIFRSNNMPKTWLAESILATLFCCLPFGIAGIVNASKVESRYNSGDTEGAIRASDEAKKWTMISFWIGVGVTVLYIIAFAAGSPGDY